MRRLVDPNSFDTLHYLTGNTGRVHVASPPLTRLIIVDGNEAFVHAIIDFLRTYAEIVVIGAHATCQDALPQARLIQPQIVLVDLDATGCSGFEAVSLLRKELPAAGIIGLTLAQDRPFHTAALRAGASDVVGKSTLTVELPQVLQRLLLRQRRNASLSLDMPLTRKEG